jgi:hypothetical protein
MIIEYFKQTSFSERGLFYEYTLKFLEWLFPNAGYMTPMGSVIMVVVIIIIAILLFGYARRHPTPKWERE